MLCIYLFTLNCCHVSNVYCQCVFDRVAGNAAYLIGTLAEIDVGKDRVVHICIEKKALMVLPTLTAMLSFDDLETVMNAAGTLGTLVCFLLS